MTGPTDAANAEERIVRIEKMVADLAVIEEKGRRLASEVREKAEKIAAERIANAGRIVAELEVLEKKAQQIAAEVGGTAAKIAAELARLKAIIQS